MCVDYTDINRAYSKDSYLLLNIDKLVDNSIGYQLLSFLDAYSGYNQIHMYKPDSVKTSFMIKRAKYQYNIMPFEFKNACATYQITMNKIFQEEIAETPEVHMDDMVVKSNQEKLHT